MPLDTPTTKSNVVAQFIEAVHETGRELAAWRRFGAQVQAFLHERDLSDAFGDFQAAQLEPMAPAQKASRAANAKRRSRR